MIMTMKARKPPTQSTAVTASAGMPILSQKVGVEIVAAGTYVAGKEAPNSYLLEISPSGFLQVYVIRPSLSMPVIGVLEKPAGALCQRGSSG
jgi:hypothetical protein